MAEVIDMHVHFGAPENSVNDCFWSEEFESTPAYWFMKLTSGSIFKKFTTERIEKKLIKAINNSKKVDKCVLLAMDGVYDEYGKFIREQTHLFVPNKFIIELAKKIERILFGASVHPYRPDWRDELEYCIANGACLCKWIPSSQQIDPTNVKCIPFYEMMAKHNLPLLMHSGPEYAIPTSNDSYIELNNPKYLRTPLENGVTVIIAHCSLPYFGMFDTQYFDDLDEYYKLIREAEEKGWKLYSDLSALATPLRNSYIPEIKEKVSHDKLLFGSDYPIPASELSYKKSKNILKWQKLVFNACSIKNPIDKNYYLIDKMGFDKKIFTNTSILFENISRD